MKNLITRKFALNESHVKLIFMLGLVAILLFISTHTHAADLLAGTDANVKETISGTGKKWMYWIDGAISLAAFAYTKKPFVLFSVLGIALFISALTSLAGS